MSGDFEKHRESGTGGGHEETERATEPVNRDVVGIRSFTPRGEGAAPPRVGLFETYPRTPGLDAWGCI